MSIYRLSIISNFKSLVARQSYLLVCGWRAVFVMFLAGEEENDRIIAYNLTV